MGHWVPGDQFTKRRRLQLGRIRAAHAQVPGARQEAKLLGVGIAHVQGLGRDIDEALFGAKCHGLPIVAAESARCLLVLRAGLIACAGHLDGPAGGQIHVACPIDLHELVGRDQFAGNGIQHIEKPVLIGLHNHVPGRPTDGQVSDHKVLDSVKIPVVARGCLIVPDIFPGVRTQGHNGGGEEIVALAAGADLAIPGSSIAGAHKDQVRLGVIGDGVPRRGPAAAQFPGPVAPGGIGEILHRLVAGLAVRLARRIGCHLEAPVELTGGGVIG